MSYVNSDEDRSALISLHEQLGTWNAVACQLDALIPNESFGQALVNLVSKGLRNSRSVHVALVNGGYVEDPPRNDVRRCWKGNEDEAEEIDEWLTYRGYKNLNEYINGIIFGGTNE